MNCEREELEYLYSEILSNYDEEETEEVFDGYDF